MLGITRTALPGPASLIEPVTGLGLAKAPIPKRWEKGYQIKTVSPSSLPRVIAYVRNQAQRHGEVVAPGD